MPSGLSRSLRVGSRRRSGFVADLWKKPSACREAGRKFNQRPSGRRLDAVNMDCVLFHPELADDFDMLADVRFGFARIVQLVIELCDWIVQHQLSILFHDAARKRQRILRLIVIGLGAGFVRRTILLSRVRSRLFSAGLRHSLRLLLWPSRGRWIFVRLLRVPR